MARTARKSADWTYSCRAVLLIHGNLFLGGVINVEKLLLEYCHPVGSLYISEKSTDPATLFGGTWERIKDRFILAAGDSYSAGSTGGEASHTLTVDEMPAHSHDIWTKDAGGSDKFWSYVTEFVSTGKWYNRDAEGAHIRSTGGGAAHNNMPPYLTMYVWKRTA